MPATTQAITSVETINPMFNVFLVDRLLQQMITCSALFD